MALSYRTPAEEVLNRFNAEDQKRIGTSSANIFAEKEKGAGKFFNYHLPPKSKEKLCSAGIYLSPFSFQTHSHPCCKTLENHLLYNVLADKLDSSFYFVGIKPGKLEFLKNMNKSLASVDAINRLVTSADRYRYGKHIISCSSKPIFGLETKKEIRLPPETRTLLPHLMTIKARNLFLHDEIHYWSKESLIDFLTILSPRMLVATLVFPPEILAGSPESLNPWCYKFKIDGKKLHFFPDGVMSESYTQHLDSGYLLKTKRIELPNGNVYGVDLVHNKFSHSIITISEGNFVNQEKRFFSNFCAIDFTNLYNLFDKKSYADCLPISFQLVSKIYRYLRTLKKPDQQSAMAKLSQLLDEPTALEIKFVEDFAKLVIDHKSESSMICPSALKNFGFFLGRLLPDKLSRLLTVVKSMSLDSFISSLAEFSFEVDLCILNAHCDTSLGPTYKNFCIEDEQAFVSNFDTAMNAKEKKMYYSKPTGKYDYSIYEGIHYPYSSNERDLLLHAFSLLLKSFSNHTDISISFFDAYKLFYKNSSRLFYSTDEIGRCHDELREKYVKVKKGLQRNLRNYFAFSGPVWFLRRRCVRRNLKFLENYPCPESNLEPEQELKYFQLIKDIKALGLKGLKNLLKVDDDISYWQKRAVQTSRQSQRKKETPTKANGGKGSVNDQSTCESLLPSTQLDRIFLKEILLNCGIKIPITSLQCNVLRLELGDQLRNRRAGWFTKPRLINYSYPGYTHKAKKWPSELEEFCHQNGIGSSYNSVLVQEYHEGAGIPPHADDEKIFDHSHPILTVNLTGSCTFGFFCKQCNVFEKLSGSLMFEMPTGFQLSHKHSVGNCSAGRVSLTFRKLRDDLTDFEMVEGVVKNNKEEVAKDVCEIIPKPHSEETNNDKNEKKNAFFVASKLPVRTSASDDGLDDDVQIVEEINHTHLLKDPSLSGEITELSRVQNLRGTYKPSELALKMLDETLTYGSMFMASAAAVLNIESMAGLGKELEYHIAMARCECILNAAKTRDTKLTYIKGSFRPAENFFGNCVSLQSVAPFYFNFLEVINMTNTSEVWIRKDSNCLDRDEDVSVLVVRGKLLVVVETLFTVEDLKFAFIHKETGDTITFPKSFFRTHTVKFFNILNDGFSTLAVLSVLAEQRVRGPKIEHFCSDGMAVEDIEGVRIDRRNQLSLDDFNIFQVAGDGNCFWTSVALVLGLDADTIKSSCRADAERKGMLANEEMKKQFERNAYAEKEVICACVKFFGLNLFIICESMGFTIEMNPINFEARETIFLLLRDQHYSPILPKNGCVVRAVASALEKPEFKILSIVCKMEDRALYDTLVSGQGLQLAEVERVMSFFDIRALVRTPEGTFVSNPSGKIPANFELKDNHLLHVTHVTDLSGVPKSNLLSNFIESEAITKLKASCDKVDYIPEINRAKRLYESLQDGTTGVLSSKLDNKLPELLNQDRDLNVGGRCLHIMLGTFGSGKSSVYRRAFNELRTHDTFIVSPRKRLANDLEVLLGIRDPNGAFAKKEKGKKREVRVLTFEKFLLHLIKPMTCSVILDEIQLFPPGYVDLISLNLTKKSSIFLVGDPCQSDYDSAGDRSIFAGIQSDISHILHNSSYNFNVLSKRFRTSMFVGRLPCLIDDEELLQDPDFSYIESLSEAKTYDLSHFDVVLVSSFEEKKVITSHFGASFECLTFGESTGLTFDRGIVVISYESIAASERRWVTALSRFRFDLMLLSTTGLTIDEVCLNFEGRFLEKFMTRKASVSDLAEFLPGSPQFKRNFGPAIGREEGIKEARLAGDPWLKTEMFLGQLEDVEIAEVEEVVMQEEWFKTHIPIAELETIRARWVHKIMLKEFREVRCGYEVSDQFTDDYPRSGGEVLTNAAERFETIYPRHRGNDSVTFLMAVKKRLRFSQSNVEAAKLKSAEPYGKFMLDEFLKKIPLRSQHNSEFMESARMEFEAKKVSKSAAVLENHSGRSCRDWLADVALIFMKSQLCTKFDNRFRDAKAGQTLACFQHSVLVRFAPYMRYIEKKLFEVLPPNFYIHSGKNLDDLDAWVKINNFSGVCTESDYEAFDSSQDHFILSFELAVMEFLGLPWDLIEDYRMIKLTLRSKLGSFAIMRFTGEASTFLFNTMANMLFTFLQYDIKGDESICFAGDDMSANKHLIVKSEFSGFLNKLSLKAKVAFTERPTFCGWNLTPHGIYKKPQLVLERLCIAREKNNLMNCLDSYAIEVAYAYSKGELIKDYMDEEEVESHYSCVRFVIRHKHLLKSDVVAKFENIA